MARKKMVRKKTTRKPRRKTTRRKRTSVARRKRRRPVRRRKKRTRRVGRVSNFDRYKKHALDPVVTTAIVSLLKNMNFARGLKSQIEKIPVLKNIGYEGTIAVAMVLLGSFFPKYRKRLYSGSIGPLCIALDKGVTQAVSITKSASGFEGEIPLDISENTDAFFDSAADELGF